MKTVVIIPTYNEKENISQIVQEIFKVVPDISIMVVDDNSPDGTASEVKRISLVHKNLFLYERNRKEGLGKAYVDSFKKILREGGWELVIMMDADFSHDPVYLPTLLDQAKNFDLVIGSRYIKGGNTVGWEMWRNFLSRFGNLYSKYILRIPVSDYTGGFNLIKTDLLKQIDLSSIDMSGYAFQIELKYLLWKAGARVTEVPIIFKNRILGESKICGHIISEGIIAPWKIKKGRLNLICPCCNEKSGNFFCRKNDCDLYKCSECNLIFVWPVKNGSEVYTQDYFSGAKDGFGYADYEKDKLASKDTFELYLDEIEKIVPSKGLLLDVGTATGFFLQLAQKRGWQAKGVELSAFASAKAMDKGLDVTTGIISEFTDQVGIFDVVTYLDVFEHLVDPRQELKLVCNLLKDDGLIIINTPNSNSLLSRLAGRFWHLLTPPEHLVIFNGDNIKKILEENGFKVLISKNIGKKFTLQYIFQTLANRYNFFVFSRLNFIFKNSWIGNMSLPINLRDNMFVIAQKSVCR